MRLEPVSSIFRRLRRWAGETPRAKRATLKDAGPDFRTGKASVDRPRISAAIMARDSAGRLPCLVTQLRTFADEIVIGVDAASRDNTFEVATRWGDRVWRFSLKRHTAPARLAMLEYASGDWVFSVDDDELLEEGFGQVVQSLVLRPEPTHFWFTRKWIVSETPCRYADSDFWYPDWQLRLFRNDPSLVHKPSRAHTGYFVSGLGVRTAAASILHLEPLLLDPLQRREKLLRYGSLGSDDSQNRQFSIPLDVPTRPVELPLIKVRDPPAEPAKVDPAIRALPALLQPGWGSEVLTVDIPHTVQPGQHMIARVEVRNTGSLAWWPTTGDRHDVNLGAHLLDASGRVLAWDQCRIRGLTIVRPGETAQTIGIFAAPTEPGDYILEWDMVSEGECWFATLGSKVARVPLEVVSPPSGNPPAAVK